MKTIKILQFFCTTLFFISLSVALCAQHILQEHKIAIDAVFEEWEMDSHPGGTVAIVQNGQLIYARGYGLANLEFKISNEKNTIFNIASVSKQFTAFAMVLLEQQGKLSIDDEVRTYIPELPDFGEKITIRHLLHHTSGLRNFQNLLGMAGWRDGDAMSNDDLLKYIQWQTDLNFPVGSEYLYCNTGFNLMATIVERVSGQSFIEWTQKNILEPLEMHHSIFRNDMTQVMMNTAKSYTGSKASGFTTPKPFWDYMGNGNLYTTVGDLAKWMINFSDHQLGGQRGYDRLLTKGVLTNGDTISYAFGIAHGNYRGLNTIGHGGSIGGYRSNLLYFPDSKTGIIILSNFSNSNPGAKSRNVADIVLAEEFTKYKPVNSQSKPEYKRTAITLSPEALNDFAGKYLVDDIMVDLSVKDEILKANVPGLGVIPLSPSSDSTFFIALANMDIIFHRDDQAKVVGLTVYNPSPQRGRKLDPAFLNSNYLAGFVGVYYSPELKTQYEIKLKGDALEVTHGRHESFSLTPISESELAGSWWLFGNVKAERDHNGEIIGIRVSNGRVRNLWFKKLGF